MSAASRRRVSAKWALPQSIDDVALVQQRDELIDHRVGRRPGLDHDDDRARGGQRRDEVRERFAGDELTLVAVLLDQAPGALGGTVVQGDGVPVAGQVPGQVAAHDGQPGHADVRGATLSHTTHPIGDSLGRSPGDRVDGATWRTGSSRCGGSDVEIWINPACSKCRSAQSILDGAGVAYTVRRYLDDPPTAAELTGLLGRLGLEPWDIARTGESVAKELALTSWPKDEASRTRWIEALAAHPKLIQRPIITADDGHAVVARTDEAVRSVLH